MTRYNNVKVTSLAVSVIFYNAFYIFHENTKPKHFSVSSLTVFGKKIEINWRFRIIYSARTENLKIENIKKYTNEGKKLLTEKGLHHRHAHNVTWFREFSRWMVILFAKAQILV